MHKPLLIALVLLTALLAALLWWQASSASDPAPGPVATVTVDGPPVEPDGVVVAEGGLDEETDELAVPEDLFRTEAEAAAPVRYLVLQVWDREQGRPAAQAEVFVLDDLQRRQIDWGELKGPYAQHWSDVAEQRGRRLLAGDDGRVEVANVAGNAIVAARLPGSYGFKWVGNKPAEVEALILQPDETVTVRVVDEAGEPVAEAPVGIGRRVPVVDRRGQAAEELQRLEQAMQFLESYMRDNPTQAAEARAKAQAVRAEYVAVRQQLGSRDGARGGGEARRQPAASAAVAAPPTRIEMRARRLSDEHGYAVFRHFQVYREDPRAKGDGGKQQALAFAANGTLAATDDSFEAVLLVPLQEPSRAVFAGRPVPDETIVLRMPATGSIALHTVDLDGRAFRQPVHAELRMLADEAAEWSRQQQRKQPDHEWIEFPFVGLGLDFTAACRLDDDDFRWQLPSFHGPRTSGERVEVELVVAPDAGMFRGRVLGADGVPMANGRPTFLINAASGRLEGEELPLDDEGRFHLPFKVRPEQTAPYRLEIRRDDVSPVLGAAIPLAQLPAGRVVDLGDLRLDAFGRIAHGLVVDDRGQPLAKASVQLQRERPGDKGQLRFVDEAFVQTTSDADGRYALFGELESGRYRMRAQVRDHFPAEELVIGGAEAQTLRLLRKSRVVGTVLAPEWLGQKRVSVQLTPVNVPGSTSLDPREEQLRDYGGKTYAYFDWVRPGTYSLAFRVREFPDPFLRVDGLVVAPGQVDLHPQLVDLDLGRLLYRFEVQAVDENGRNMDSLRPLLARITRPNGERAFLGFPLKGGGVEILSAAPQLEVVPLADGYVAEPCVLAAGRSELVFRAIPPVDVHLAGLHAMAGAASVQVLLERIDDRLPSELLQFDGQSRRIANWYARARFSAQMLGADDTARMVVTGDGRHRVILRFGVGQKVKPATVALDAVDVRVPAGGQPQQFTPSYDRAVVQQAIAEVAERIRQREGGDASSRR